MAYGRSQTASCGVKQRKCSRDTRIRIRIRIRTSSGDITYKNEERRWKMEDGISDAECGLIDESHTLYIVERTQD